MALPKQASGGGQWPIPGTNRPTRAAYSRYCLPWVRAQVRLLHAADLDLDPDDQQQQGQRRSTRTAPSAPPHLGGDHAGEDRVPRPPEHPAGDQGGPLPRVHPDPPRVTHRGLGRQHHPEPGHRDHDTQTRPPRPGAPRAATTRSPPAPARRHPRTSDPANAAAPHRAGAPVSRDTPAHPVLPVRPECCTVRKPNANTRPATYTTNATLTSRPSPTDLLHRRRPNLNDRPDSHHQQPSRGRPLPRAGAS